MTFQNKIKPGLLGAALLSLALCGTAGAQLPPEVEADRLLLLARDSMEAKEWSKAREAFEGILALGIAVPPNFHYHYARALSQNGRPAQARERLTLYLKNADRGSETYRDALALFNQVDAAAKRAEENERKAAAAAAKKEEEARLVSAEAQAKKVRETLARAEAGDANAQHTAGNWYRQGTNGLKADNAVARKWYERAAAQNHASALTVLAFLHINGLGGEKDLAKARDYFLRAAKLNNANATYNLGVIYQTGLGVEKDSVAAAQWYRKGAELGYSISQYHLANMYMSGDGVPRDRNLAFELYEKAAKQGLKEAKDQLKTHFPGTHKFD